MRIRHITLLAKTEIQKIGSFASLTGNALFSQRFQRNTHCAGKDDGTNARNRFNNYIQIVDKHSVETQDWTSAKSSQTNAPIMQAMYIS